MKSLFSVTASLILTGGLYAQTETTTDYGVKVTSGSKTEAASVSDGTEVGSRGLTVSAKEGLSRAFSTVLAGSSKVVVYESAIATSNSSKTSAAAGTTTKKGGSIGEAHSVVTRIGAKDGTKGKVTVAWSRFTCSKSGAVLRTVVSVNGRALATFTQQDRSTVKTFEVTAGNSGISITVTTAGAASVKGKGAVRYSARVSASFRASASTEKCTFKSFGKQCGLKLVPSTKVIKDKQGKEQHFVCLTVKCPDRHASALLAFGLRKLEPPVKLPNGGCQVFLDPLVMMPLGWKRTACGIVGKTEEFVILVQGAAISKSKGYQKVETTQGVEVKCPKPR